MNFRLSLSFSTSKTHPLLFQPTPDFPCGVRSFKVSWRKLSETEVGTRARLPATKSRPHIVPHVLHFLGFLPPLFCCPSLYHLFQRTRLNQRLQFLYNLKGSQRTFHLTSYFAGRELKLKCAILPSITGSEFLTPLKPVAFPAMSKK